MTEPAPPRAFSGTPPPPPGHHDLRIVGTVVPKVFLDTSAYFQATYRNALAASAGVGDLAVYWSSGIRAEIVHVAERMVLAETARRLQHLLPDDRAASIEAALERVRN